MLIYDWIVNTLFGDGLFEGGCPVFFVGAVGAEAGAGAMFGGGAGADCNMKSVKTLNLFSSWRTCIYANNMYI